MTQEEEKGVEDQEEKEKDEEEVEEQVPMELPPVNFENFVFGLYNTARIHLGFHDPETNRLIQNLPLARHTIDTLGMIQEKTSGNLTAPEINLLENLLYELRMNYLRAAKPVEEEPRKEPEEEKKEEKTESSEESEVQETKEKESG